ncbi:ALP1-like protein [Tanacetum coccineum]
MSAKGDKIVGNIPVFIGQTEGASTIPEPSNDDHKRILFKQKQESARKDVERAFGVLKKKWAILANPARALRKDKIATAEKPFVSTSDFEWIDFLRQLNYDESKTPFTNISTFEKNEATQEEEGDDEVNKARTDDDDDEDKDEDDEESQFSLEAREKQNTPIPTPLETQSAHDVLRHWEDKRAPRLSPLRDPGAGPVITNINLATGTSIPVHTTHPTSSTSIVQPPSQIKPKTIRWDEDKPPTPPTSDDFIQYPHPRSDNQQPPSSPDKQVDAQEPYPPKTTQASIVQPPLLQLDQELTNMHAILTMHYIKTLFIRTSQDIPLEDMNSEILTRMYTQPQLKTQQLRLLAELLKSGYHIQQLQQTCRGDALRKRPHDDHQDDDQHDREKAKRPCTTDDFSSMPTRNTNT